MKNQAFDFSVDVLQAILWQYNDAKNLQAVLEGKQAWYDLNQEGFWTDWLRDVFDLRTANDFGCAVWAILLGVPLSVVLKPDFLNKLCWGYGTHYGNYGRSNYGVQNASNIGLTLAQKRLVLQLRYFQLISRGNIPQTNQFVKMAFEPFGMVYALDPLDMSEIVYVFTFALPSALSFVLQFYDILPRPEGVGVRYVVTTRLVFGYGPGNSNYERSNYGE